jgi:sialate O-acetylesterase
MRTIVACWVVGATACAAMGDVKPAEIFADHVVLQRDAALPIWGTADAGEKITITAGDRRAEATAGADGRWLARIDPLKAGGPIEVTIAGKNSVTIKDVLVGEVWVGAGQSNMQMRLDQADGGVEAATAANDAQVRFFMTGGGAEAEPQTKINGRWQLCTPENAKAWSAAGYFFAMELRRELGVPVALVQNAVGWTTAETWMSREAIRGDAEFKTDIADRWDRWGAAYPNALKAYEPKKAAWEKEAEKAKAGGKAAPPEPGVPWNPAFQHRDSMLYNSLVHPLIPYAIRGVIWYQGETNASRGDQYRRLFPALIRDWRTHWGQGDFPFIFVQIAPLGGNAGGGGTDRAEVREAQREALSVKNTAMVSTIDIGMAEDEHPKNKKEVGRRLGLAAMKLVYGKAATIASGPVYKSMRIEGKSVRLTFTEIDGGLKSKEGGPLVGFTIAGADGKFVPAQAKIEGETVVVWAEGIEKPAAVRYAFLNWPAVSLFNAAGLPAGPFRTDDFPLSTAGEKRIFFEQIGLDEETLSQKPKPDR